LKLDLFLDRIANQKSALFVPEAEEARMWFVTLESRADRRGM
jgi:hypothetical protein